MLQSIILSGVFLFIGGERKFPVSEISPELRKNAHAVFRLDEATFVIEAKNKAIFRVHQVITILNAQGKKYADLAVSYDKLRKINEFKGAAYDSAGVLLKKLKSSEIEDQSSISQGSLFEDDRIKYADLSQTKYPYTVEFEYELAFNFLFYIPGWQVMPAYHVSVEKSVYELVYPTSLSPRYKMIASEVTPEKRKLDNGKESLRWVFSNRPSYQREPHGQPLHEITPNILVAPTEFQYESYSGKMDTWDGFAQWQKSLLDGRTDLPPTLKAKVKEITAGKKTVEEKTKALYEYLQAKTRYVSIQLGIGGFQPFKAEAVETNSYGDCKALSNYMVAILKEAGIDAYYTLIKAGEDEPDIHVDFPSTQFNHVVAMVPNQKDTLWLECTSQTKPFGFAGTFTGNRHALAITEKGGKIVRTPNYDVNTNRQTRTALVKLLQNGDGTTHAITTYKGLQYENDDLNFVINDSPDEQKKWVQKNTSIPNFEIMDFKFDNQNSKIPVAKVEVNLNLKRLASISGKRFFLTPNLMNRFSYVPEKVAERKTEVVRNFGFEDFDTIQYQIPEAAYPEFMPEPVKINSRFGEYEAKFEFKESKVFYFRRLKVFKGRFPKESYPELVDFYKNISKADNIKLVFLNKT